MARIFLIEKELDVAVWIADILKEEGHEPSCHASGKGAWEEAKRFQPDLIVFDMGIDDMDADKVVEQIRAVQALRLTPILAVSSRGTGRDDARRFGARAFLEKPFDIAALLNLVDRAIYKT